MEDNFSSKKDLLNSRMKERHLQRQNENLRSEKSDVNTEELVTLFYKDMDPLVELIESRINSASSCETENSEEFLNSLSENIQKLQELINDAGLYLPPYDIKKSQDKLNMLNKNFQDMQSLVKPKKKFGFKNRKQKTGISTVDGRLKNMSISETTTEECKRKVLTENCYNVSNQSNQKILLSRDQVHGRDVMISGLVDCELQIQGNPLTLHLSSITRCKILSGPVSTSVMIDTCQDTCIAISCQQLRTHSTTNTDIYLHTTAKAIIEDCKGIRVAPYNWNYQSIDQDFTDSGLNRSVNNWDQIGDFNWLSVDKSSPNWSILPEQDRKTFETA